MRLSSRQQATQQLDLQISMTSMIDVVFLLLIFFLMTTSFIQPERQLTSNIKVERTDSGLNQSDLEPAVVDIYLFGDSVVYQLGAVKSSSLEDIKPILTDFTNKSDGGFVRVGRGVNFEHAAQTIGAFKAHGFKNVSYLPAK